VPGEGLRNKRHNRRLLPYSLYSAVAASLLPAPTAFSTFLIWERIRERNDMLWLRRFTLWRARF